MNKNKDHIFSKLVVYYKLLTGFIEFLLGLSIVFLGKKIANVYTSYKLNELLEDPHDLFINLIGKITPIFVQYHTYFIVTLVLFGVVKIIAAMGLLQGKEWGLNILVIFFFIMLPFDIYTFFSHPSLTKTVYFFVNTLITLYLTEFKPFNYLFKYYSHAKKSIKRLIQ